MKYIKLIPYIPNAEGYIQDKDPKVYVNKECICNICFDYPKCCTRIELTNGSVIYVEDKIDDILKECEE